MKQYIKMIFCFLMCISINVIPLKAEEQTYSYNEYMEILQREGAEYDLIISLDDTNSQNQNYTSSQVADALSSIRTFADTVHIVPHDTVNLPYAQYSTGIKYGYFDVVAANGMATITVEIYANTSSTKVTSAYIRDIYQSGVSLGFQSWVTTSSAITLNTPENGYVRANVSGRATFNISGIVVTKNVSNQGVLIYCL